MKRPNIILIMTDQLRGDCMGFAGHPEVKTPYLDTLASKGVVFDNAYSACPSCIPARASLYTGMSQRKHGRVGYEDGIAWDYPHTMAGELAKAGYYTQCVGKMHVYPLRNLMGFHHIELHDGYLHYNRRSDIPYYENQKTADDYMYWLKQEKGIDADVIDTGLECNSWVSRPWMYEEQYHPTNWVTSRCIDFLRRRDRSKPFFLMASYLRPHTPFDAPEYYFDLYKNISLTPPAVGSWEDTEELQKKGRIFDSITGPLDPEQIRQAQIGYYACITHLDHQIGRLLQALIDDGIYEDCVFVFTSDHGEQLCDHHLFRKALPYQGSIHIPMIISGNEARLAGREGTVCHGLAELRDVMPTLIDIAGGKIPDSVEGKSLMPLAADPKKRIRDYLHGEHSFGERSNQWIVTEHEKYIWYSQTDQEQFFDLDNDPHETHDLMAEKPMRAKILKDILIRELAGREEGYTDGERLIPRRRPQNCLGHLRKGS